MSLHRWLVGPSAHSGVQSSYLPHAEKGSSTEVANKEVACELEICGKKRNWVRGDYHHYTAETRAKIAKYACESGNKAAVKKYSVELSHPVSEGTVRNFKRKYLEQLKSVTDPDLVTSLDVGINDQFKTLLKQEFSRWYANEVQEAMRNGVTISDIKVDLRASLMKPLHANWLMCAISTLSDKCDAIKKRLKLLESLTTYSRSQTSLILYTIVLY